MRKCFPAFRERKNRNCCHFWKKFAVTGKNGTEKTRIHSNMGTGMDAGMTVGTTTVMDTMEAQMGMEDADHVEIYQKVSALCHCRWSVYDRRGDDGSAAAGIYEPDCG